MKRDMDLIRDILLEVEAAEAGNSIEFLHSGGFKHSHPAVTEHVALLEEEGLIDAQILPEHIYRIRRLTMAGHDWLDAARDPGIWDRAKERLAKVGMKGAELSFVKEILLDIIRKSLS